MPLAQKFSGSVSLSTSIATSLPGATTAGNSIFIFIQSAATVTTPSGFISRAPQVNFTGFYLFEKLVASGNSTDTPTITNGSAVNATWQIAEYSGVTATAATATGNNLTFQTNGSKATPNITPTAGDRLILAFVGAMASAGTSTFTAGDPSSWTNSFTGQDSILRTGSGTAGAESFASGWADRFVTANGSTAYSTGATMTVNTGTQHPSTIIAAYAHTAGGTVFNDSVTEAATATESDSAVATFAVSRSEAGTATDSPSSTAVFSASNTETATATDTEGGGYTVSQSEAGSATDSPNAAAVMVASVAETATATDAPVALAVFTTSTIEVATATDTTDTATIYFVSVSESATATDASNGSIGPLPPADAGAQSFPFIANVGSLMGR